MRGKRFGAAVALLLGGCIPSAHPPETPRPMETDAIRYETGPCFGACPVYAVTVHPDGSGVFEGRRFTAVTGTRSFHATPAQVAAFAARLAPYRPASGERRYAPGEANCRNAATDMPSVTVRWTRAAGDSQSLYFYFGCNRQALGRMADALGNAPDALPIQDMIGARP